MISTLYCLIYDFLCICDDFLLFSVFFGLTKCDSPFYLYLNSGELIFKTKIVGYNCYKLGIGRLAATVLNSVSEIGIKGIDIAPVPRNLDSMANSSFYS